MLIDWFTVFAQVLNFLILVWLMKRFLYKPVLEAIASREKRIAKTLQDAKELETEAHKERDAFEKKNAEFDIQRAALLAKAQADADAGRTRLLKEARQESDAVSEKRRQALLAEQQTLNSDLVIRTQEEVFAIASKTLADLAGASLEAQLVDVFVRRLRDYSPKEREALLPTFQGRDNDMTVRSTFPLPLAQQDDIRKVINDLFAPSPVLHFENSSELVGGIELIANGRKIGWSISGYLGLMEKGVSEVLSASQKVPLGTP
jgi:F-type H+-transporting ATPase subunit b